MTNEKRKERSAVPNMNACCNLAAQLLYLPRASLFNEF